jgi:hypothetical protein
MLGSESISVHELLVAMYYEQVSADKQWVPINTLTSAYDFGEMLDRFMTGLMDHGLAWPTNFDGDANSTSFGLTDAGVQRARRLILNGEQVEKFADIPVGALIRHDGASFTDDPRPYALIPPYDFQMPGFETRSDNSANYESSKWTGTQHILVDAQVLSQVRENAKSLRSAVYSIRFESNSESADVKGLADALVHVCDMATPEVGIIDRILASPKFKTYAALMTIIATIRGALGI